MPKKSKKLTERQNEVFAFIYCQIKEKYPPTIREIGGYFGFSEKAAHDHVLAIEKKGYIQRLKGIPRCIRIIDDPVPIPELFTFEITTDMIIKENGFQAGEFLRLRRQAVGASGDIALVDEQGTLTLCKLASPMFGIIGKVIGHTLAIA